MITEPSTYDMLIKALYMTGFVALCALAFVGLSTIIGMITYSIKRQRQTRRIDRDIRHFEKLQRKHNQHAEENKG